MNQTFFIFAVFSTLTRPGLLGVKSPPPGGSSRPAAQTSRGSWTHCPGQRPPQNIFEKYQENA